MWTDIDLNECEIDLNECEIDLNKCEINRNVCEIDLNKCEFDLTKCEIDLNEIWDRSNYIAQSMQSGGTYASLPTYMIKEGLKIGPPQSDDICMGFRGVTPPENVWI